MSNHVCYFSQHGMKHHMGYMLLETEFANSSLLFQLTWDICKWRQSLSIHVCYFSQYGIDASGDRVCQFMCVISINMG